MNLHTPSSLEDRLLLELQSGPLPSSELIQRLQRQRPGTTKQGVYACLRQLQQQEVVILHQATVSLSSVWLGKMSSWLSVARRAYLASATETDAVLNLEDGDSIRYAFQNPTRTDIFWSHIFFLLSIATPSGEPVYIYNPHEWFLLARTENELTLFQDLQKRGHPTLVTVGHRTKLDKTVASYFDGKQTQYHMLDKPLFPKQNYYLNILGDILIEVWLDETVSLQINDLYDRATTYGPTESHLLQSLITKRGKNRLKVTRNHKRATKLKRMLGKSFAIKKS